MDVYKSSERKAAVLSHGKPLAKKCDVLSLQGHALDCCALRTALVLGSLPMSLISSSTISDNFLAVVSIILKDL